MVTAFRDGFQSVYGARVLTKDFLPAVEAARNAGITHFEAGGGARFQSLFFYCNENAFDMMDSFRETTGPDANLQTLARGVNVVGLESQSSDIIKLHAELFKKHGMTTIRNFDALNDVNNLIFSGKCIKEAGLKHEVVVAMMSLPPGWVGSEEVHNQGFYCGVLRNILDSGLHFDSVCFKDASGTATPRTVYETIRAAREMLPPEVSLRFHTHDTAGTSILCYGAALRGGADGLDVSMAPVSGGTCQPDIITLWHAMRGTEYDLGIDIDKIIEAEEVFKECMADYFVPPEAKAVEPIIPFSPMPGGALTANTQMMRDNNIMNRYPEVIRAMGEVVRRGGFGSSVTPVSQFYFQQAFNNVMIGPWKKIADGYGKMVLGYFGKTPVEPDQEIVKIAAEQLGLEPTKKTPLEINDEDPDKGVAPAKKMLQDAGLAITDENIFIASTCREKGIAYLKGEAKVNVRKINRKADGGGPEGYTVVVNGREYGITLRGGEAVVNGKKYTVDVREGIREKTGVAAEPVKGASEDAKSVKAPLPGVVVRIVVDEGDTIDDGDTILIMEAMKMETEIKSPAAGVVESINVNVGDQVAAGKILAVIK
jgi:pyruvate carboxylase subunit B